MTPCVEWTKFKDKAGYGRRRFDGKTVVAHRVAYAQHHGLDMSAIAGKVIRHKCDNRACVNPEHLEIGTQADNVRDMVARGRQAKGDILGKRGAAHWRAKLSEDQVRAIRLRHVFRDAFNGARALAREFGISEGVVSQIVHRKLWKHV